MNILPSIYKLFHFNLIMSSLYLVKLKITQKQQTAYAVHSVEPIVPDIRRKSFNVYFSLFVRKFLQQSSNRKLLTFSCVLLKNYFQTKCGYFNM